MSSLIYIDDLDVVGKPRLIFTANAPDRKGLAFKSFSIKLPKTTNNNRLLKIWGAGEQSDLTFDATLTITGVQLIGTLQVTEIDRDKAKAVFIAGNGRLWEDMSTVQLQDIDMSDADVVLNSTNVIASETGTPFVLFDLTDRGAFKTATAIDVTDRFPALNLVELLTRIFNDFDIGVQFEGFNGDEYLLFMQDSAIRNSDDWMQEAYFRAHVGSSGMSAEDSGTGTDTFSITMQLDYSVEDDDEGGNFTSDTYTVPEDGTYRFKARYSLTYTRPATATVSSLSATVQIRRNGSAAVTQAVTVDLSTLVNDTVTGEVDLLPMEMQSGDTVAVVATFDGQIVPDGGGAWAVSLTETNTENSNYFYNELSRWYGTGSTVEISDILPSMSVIDFLRAVTSALAIEIYYDDANGIVTLKAGGHNTGQTIEVEVFNIERSIDEIQSVVVEFETDKVRQPGSYFYDKDDSTSEATVKLPVARTLRTRCGRVGITIPTLWNSGDPLASEQYFLPPAQKTRGAMRIVRKLPALTDSYTLTYAGGSATQSTVLNLQDVDYYALNVYDYCRAPVTYTATARMDVEKFRSMEYFKKYLLIRDRYTNEGFLTQLISAEQIDQNLFKLTLVSAFLSPFDPTDNERVGADTVAFTGSTSGGGGTAEEYTLPADMLRTTVSGQVSGLTEKTTPVDADNFMIEDSAASNAKKRVKWSSIKATLKTYFDNIYYGAIAGQFNATAEKTALANADLIVIEDSADTFNKKKVTWTNIKVFLKTYFDNIYYGAVSGQFAATTEKTSITANDLFIIEDSAASNGKKSLKYSTLKTALDSLYGFWSAVTGGIRTNNRVGINTYPGTGTGVKVVDINFGVDSKSTGNCAYRAEIEGNADFSFYPIITCYRTTTSTAAAGIGMIMPFYIQNSAGSNVLAAYTQVKLTNATAGSEKAEYSICVNSAVRLKIDDSNNVVAQTGVNYVVQSGDAYYYGDTATDGSWRSIRAGNNLLHQRRESGTWVTKQTISA